MRPSRLPTTLALQFHLIYATMLSSAVTGRRWPIYLLKNFLIASDKLSRNRANMSQRARYCQCHMSSFLSSTYELADRVRVFLVSGNIVNLLSLRQTPRTNQDTLKILTRHRDLSQH
ncbi:hypothetical protein DFH29DRAFT_186115 [Suillus ampliporus]|nr:hypothetical protein DFH29DRAFT_186115 [Suillus ampliporus]